MRCRGGCGSGAFARSGHRYVELAWRPWEKLQLGTLKHAASEAWMRRLSSCRTAGVVDPCGLSSTNINVALTQANDKFTFQ